MMCSEAAKTDLLSWKPPQEDYADIKPLDSPGAFNASLYLFEAEQTYQEIMNALALEELRQMAFDSKSYLHEDSSNLPALYHGTLALPGSGTNTNTSSNTPEDKAKQEKKKNFFKKIGTAIIEFIKKIWHVIVAVWKWAVSKFDKYFLTTNSFLKKYKSQLLNVKSITFEGYEFPKKDMISFDLLKEEDFVKILQNNDDLDRCKEMYLSKYTHNIGRNIKSPNDVTEEKLKQEYYGIRSVHKFNIKEQIELIESIPKLKSELETIFKKIQKEYEFFQFKLNSLLIANFFSINKVLLRDEVAFYQKLVSFVKWVVTSNRLIYDTFIKSLVDKTRQAKAICIKALEVKKDDEKEKSQNESSIFQDTRSIAYLLNKV